MNITDESIDGAAVAHLEGNLDTTTAPEVMAHLDGLIEGGTTTLSGTITDPGTLDSFSLEIDWGDGNTETIVYPAGTTGFSETHQYLDDPSA